MYSPLKIKKEVQKGKKKIQEQMEITNQERKRKSKTTSERRRKPSGPQIGPVHGPPFRSS